MSEAPLVVLSCGEASGDLYCSKIARALRMQRPDLRLAGIAGPRSREAGVEPWEHQENLAVMGFVEIVRHFPRIRRIGLDLVARAREEGASLFLPVDYPGFHMRVARKMRREGIGVLDFIPPKTWSWGRHRLKGLPESVDGAAVIFPFEEDHYRAAGVAAHFVGHPLVDVHADAIAEGDRSREGLLLAPGSRRQELVRIVPIMARAIRELRAGGMLPDLVTVSRAPGVDPALLEPLLREGGALSERELFTDLRSARAAVVCSGTATVEAALAGCAHAIVYRTGTLTYAIARRVATVEHIGMANIVLGRRAFPELLQGDLNSAALVATLEPLLAEDSEESRAQQTACAELRSALGEPGCFARVADMALAQLDAGSN
jgi:lipid-A-disaccharide synthase